MKIDAKTRAKMSEIDEADLVRELVALNGLHEFIREFWPIVQPGTPFVDGWHIGAICEFLEAFARRQIVDGVISIPPGHGKTKNCSVLFPCWVWTWQPHHRFLLGSYNDQFLVRDGRQALDVLNSELYRKAWPHVQLKEAMPAAKYFENTAGGLRFAMTPGGSSTGEHGHTRMCDDPMKATERRSPKAKEKILDWWNGAMSSRRASGIPFGSLIIMQRLALDDLAGAMLERGYEHLMLPAEYVPNAWWDYGCSLGKLDQRTKAGELLWPELKPKEEVDKLKKELGSPADAEAQYQQNPVPDTGGIVERAWIRRWTTDESDTGARLPPRHMMRVITSWDLAFDGEEESHSRVCGAVWGACRVAGVPRYFLLDAFAEHMNYPDTKERFRKLLGGHPNGDKTRPRYPGNPLWLGAGAHLIEKKANGSAMIAEMRKEFQGIEVVNPKDTKGDRLIVHSDKFRSGQVWFPPELVCPQIEELISELVFFPNGAYDDFVDTTTQALDKLSGANAAFWEAIRKLGDRGR